jgi:ADP-heptose:LPS heptosyltransferase
MLASRSRIIVAPMASSSLKTKIFLMLMFRKIYVPRSFVKRSFLFMRKTPFLLKDGRVHQVDFYVQFLAFVDPLIEGGAVLPEELGLSGYPTDKLTAKARVRKSIVIGLSCGVAERHKIPRPTVFASLVNAIACRTEIEVTIIGNHDDRLLIEEFKCFLAPDIPTVEIIDQPVEKLINQLEIYDLGISGTTGQGHMMAAAQIPMLVLSGVTSPHESGPFVRRAAILRHSFACGPCYQTEFKWGCKLLRCMDFLDIEQGSRMALLLLQDSQFGLDWFTAYKRRGIVEVEQIKELHTKPVTRWTITGE